LAGSSNDRISLPVYAQPRLHRPLLAAALAVAVVAVPAAAARAATGSTTLHAAAHATPTLGGFGIKPAGRGGARRGYVVRRAGPGSRFQDEVVVQNTSRHPLTLRIYPVGATTGATSGAVYGPRESRPAGTGGWISTADSHVTVPAGGSVSVPFAVAVTRGARPGDHLGGIAVERPAPTRSTGRFSTRQVLRAVTAVQVRVPGAAVFQPRLTDIGIQAIAGTDVASVAIGLGDGGRLLGKPKLTVTLAGPRGYRRTVARPLDTLLPGDTISYPFAWPDALTPGWYDVRVVATGGRRPVQLQRRIHLTVPLQGTRQPAPVAAPPVAAPNRWWIVAVAAGALAAAIAGGALAWRRRRRLHAHPVAEGAADA